MTTDLKLPAGMSLDKCPFCGGDARLLLSDDEYYVRCGKASCLVTPVTNAYPTKHSACRAWNHRSTPDQLDTIISTRLRSAS